LGRIFIEGVKNRMLTTIFGTKGVEIIRGWRKLHNEDLNKFSKFSKNDQVSEDAMGRVRNMHV
jgi:hypothetical protein